MAAAATDAVDSPPCAVESTALFIFLFLFRICARAQFRTSFSRMLRTIVKYFNDLKKHIYIYILHFVFFLHLHVNAVVLSIQCTQQTRTRCSVHCTTTHTMNFAINQKPKVIKILVRVRCGAVRCAVPYSTAHKQQNKQ